MPPVVFPSRIPEATQKNTYRAPTGHCGNNLTKKDELNTHIDCEHEEKMILVTIVETTLGRK
jgi:hypothetical protein